MAKRMLADVLWEAANEHLWDGDSFDADITASCCAAYRAEKGHEWGYRHDRWADAVKASKAVRFMRSLGCDVKDTHFEEPTWEQRQGARYLWLLLAMHVAEDRGLSA